MNIYAHKDANIRKTWLLMALFFGVVVGLGWTFSYIYDDQIIVIVAVVFSVLMNIISYWNSDKIVIAISGAKPADPQIHLELHRIVENLAITAGLPKPKVYVIEDNAPNAFATGRDPEHAAVAVTTGLLSILDRSELEGVIAHELSHVGNRDILVSTVAVVLVGFVTLLSDFFLRTMRFGGSRDRKGGHPAILIIGIILAILSPIAATLIHLGISRKREFLADASGALLTRYPEGLAAALKKIAVASQPLMRANHATAHLYIANPFGDGKSSKQSFLTKIFSTHPPLEERITALLEK